MAYTTDRSWTAGETVTAALLTVYLRDNLKWLSTDKPMVRCYYNAALAIADATFVPVSMNTNRFDNAGLHDTVTNNTRIKTNSTSVLGKYLFGGAITFDANGTGSRNYALRITGATVIANPGWQAGNGILQTNLSTSALWNMTSISDYAEHLAYQSSGGALNLTSSATSSEMWAVWMGF